MTLKLLSADAFRAAAKDGGRPEGAVFSLRSNDPQPVDGTRTVRFVFSDDSVDLAGDSISQDGWDLDDFNANPVALFSHASWEPPIGRASNVGVKGNKLIGDIEFASADVYPFADTIFRLVQAKFLKAVSVGFLPIEYEFAKDATRPYGLNFVKQKLLEISTCSVPCNPNALAEARSLGIDTEPLREWASKVLDTGGSVMVPRDLLEETFRQAKTPRSTRQKYLAKAETPDWKVGAAKDLPLDTADAWDGPAAAKRMLDEAGFDGDNPDAAKAARGFLIHDAANPTLRGSYKLPFADIVGGTLKAVKGGIDAASSRLPQTDAPAAVLDDAKGVVAAYEKAFGEAKSADPADMPPGNCGLAKDTECGMKNIAQCAVHAPPKDKTTTAPENKSGRRISTANEALLKEAMDHHASATKCIQTVLDSNAAAGAEDDETPLDSSNNLVIPLTEEGKRLQRLAEARELTAPARAS
jgi:HK97 family phage prohead protease